MTDEKRREKRLKAKLPRGWLCLKTIALGFSGMPDRELIGPKAQHLWVELKGRKGDKGTPRQQTVQKLLIEMGHEVWHVTTDEKLEELLNTFDFR